MRIIHFGDLHVWGNPFVFYDFLYPKRYLGAVNLFLNRKKKFPKDLGQSVINSILEEEADIVAFTGDITTASLKSEFANAAKMLQPIRSKWGENFLMIPGNHDRYTRQAEKKDRYGKYFPYGRIHQVRVVAIDSIEGDYAALMFDASQPFMFRSNGLLSAHLKSEIEAEFEKLDGKNVILMGHYPAVYPSCVGISRGHQLINRHDLKEVIEKYSPIVYLHGHKHIRWRLGNAINCGSAGMLSTDPYKQAGYTIVQLEQKEIKEVLACSVSESGRVERVSHSGDF